MTNNVKLDVANNAMDKYVNFMVGREMAKQLRSKELKIRARETRLAEKRVKTKLAKLNKQVAEANKIKALNKSLQSKIAKLEVLLKKEKTASVEFKRLVNNNYKVIRVVRNCLLLKKGLAAFEDSIKGMSLSTNRDSGGYNTGVRRTVKF